MNRREALAALVSLPQTARISVANVKPSDVIVVECDELMTPDMAQNIKESMQQVWPNHKCVVLSGGLKLRIASEG